MASSGSTCCLTALTNVGADFSRQAGFVFQASPQTTTMAQNQPRPNANPAPTPAPTTNSPTQATSSAPATSQSVFLIPPNAPAGGILMTQPPQTAVSFYKIGSSQTITFGWNFTSLFRDPQSLTVSAICDNGNTYPVGPTDGVLPGTATQLLWDVQAWQENNPQLPLAQGTCTLTMWDERGATALPSPGFMQTFNDLQFGLYTPQPYTALADGEYYFTI